MNKAAKFVKEKIEKNEDKIFWFLFCSIVVLNAILFFFAATSLGQTLVVLTTISGLIILWYTTWYTKDGIFKAIIYSAAFFSAIVSLQGSVPVVAPIVDISLGETTYGFVHDTHTTTWREFKIAVKPPLLLTKIDSLNCRDYDIVPIKRGRYDAMLEPIKMYFENNFSEGNDAFYRTLSICLDHSKGLDAWKLGTLSTSIYLESIQPVRVFLPNLPFARNADNNQYITRTLNIENKSLYYTDIMLSNDETFPVIFWTRLQIKNDTDAYDSLRNLVFDNSCENVLAYPVLELDNFAKVREPQIIQDGTILGNYTIRLGTTSWFLNANRLEPRESKTYYLVFECEK